MIWPKICRLDFGQSFSCKCSHLRKCFPALCSICYRVLESIGINGNIDLKCVNYGHFIPPVNTRKSKVFWCFSGGIKCQQLIHFVTRFPFIPILPSILQQLLQNTRKLLSIDVNEKHGYEMDWNHPWLKLL